MLYDFFKERVFIRDAFYIIYIVQLLTSGLGGGIGEDKRTRGERIRIMYNFDDFYQSTLIAIVCRGYNAAFPAIADVYLYYDGSVDMQI